MFTNSNFRLMKHVTFVHITGTLSGALGLPISFQEDIPVLIMDVELYKAGTPYFIPSRYSGFENGCGTLQAWDSLLHFK